MIARGTDVWRSFTDFLFEAFAYIDAHNGAVTALATVAIGIFTLVLVIVTRRQAILTKQSVRIAERALLSTERAFVYLDDFDTSDHALSFRGSGERQLEFLRLIVKPHWRNSGTTPTRDMTILVNWTHFPGPLRDDFSFAYGENIKPSPMFLAPQANEWSEAISIPGPIATAAINETERIFVWGRVDYRDILDGTRPHFTKWCYELKITRFMNEPRFQFVAFGIHNSTDEDTGRQHEPNAAYTLPLAARR